MRADLPARNRLSSRNGPLNPRYSRAVWELLIPEKID